ncbi:MAG: insulinase family protein [Firmicutes bacterium]|nr:insulinase family protein [Bacillota bacterium]
MVGDFFPATLSNGVRVYIYPTSKFKTNTVKVFLHNRLGRDTVTHMALAPMVLKRGCSGLETRKEIARHLDDMYGARFDAGVFKLGEHHMMQLGLEVVNHKYVGAGEDLLARGLDFLRRVTLEPVTSGATGGAAGGETGPSFKREYVEQEKDVLTREIAGIINEKSRYAVVRCVQEMCGGEPFGLHELGVAEDIPSIDGASLYGLYKESLETNPVDVCVIGDVDREYAFDLVERAFSFDRRGGGEIPGTIRKKAPGEPRFVTERQAVNQGKLCLGYRVDASPREDLYPLMFYDGVFGGFVHSKLFTNVREKASLAYYASSTYNPVKGLLLVTSGIDVDKKDQAFDIICRQAEDIRKGDVSDEEMDYTRKALVNRLRSWEDNPASIIASFLELLALGRPETLDERIAAVMEVTKDQVIEAASRVDLDTVYFLTNK